MRLNKYELDSIVSIVRNLISSKEAIAAEKAKNAFFTKHKKEVSSAVAIINKAAKDLKALPKSVKQFVDFNSLNVEVNDILYDILDDLWRGSKERISVQNKKASSKEIQDKVVEIASHCTELDLVYAKVKKFYKVLQK